MTVEITPELIAICLTFVGLLVGLVVGFATIAGRLIKIGRWMQSVDNRLENLEKGQVQILTALQNHVHVSDGAPPLFYTPLIRPHVPPTMVMPNDDPVSSGQGQPSD